MSAASDRANAAIAALANAAADLVIKQHVYAEALSASSQAQDAKAAADNVFFAAQVEVDAAIADLQAEKAKLTDSTK
jgi:hypothetical protein